MNSPSLTNIQNIIRSLALRGGSAQQEPQPTSAVQSSAHCGTAALLSGPEVLCTMIQPGVQASPKLSKQSQIGSFYPPQTGTLCFQYQAARHDMHSVLWCAGKRELGSWCSGRKRDQRGG